MKASRAALLYLLTAALVCAAEHRGRVLSAGVPIPGATVIASQGEQRIITTTDEAGQYHLPNLTPGVWDITVEMFGFLPARRQLRVEAGESFAEWTLTLRSALPADEQAGQPPSEQNPLAALAEESAAEEAEVDEREANEALLIHGSLSRGLELREEEGLPIRSDETAGPGKGGPGLKAGRPATGLKSAAREGAAKKLGRLPRVRAVRKSTAASFGNRRRQSNEGLRGAVNLGWRNSALDARPFSLTGLTAPKPSYAHTRFGLMAGGPLHIPKVLGTERTLFFVNYTGVRSRNPYQAVGTVPTAAERTGDFASSWLRGPITIFDPLSRLPFPENRVPAARFDSAARGLLEFIPAPSQLGRVQNYQWLGSTRQNADNLALRVSQPLTARHRLSWSLNWQAREGDALQPFGFRDQNRGRSWRTELGWSYNLNRRLIEDLRWSFNRNRNQIFPFFAFRRNVAAELGIQGASQESQNWGPPNLSFTNFADLTEANTSLRRDQNSAVTQSLTLTRGRHNLSFGGEYRRVQLNSRTDQNARGSFSFSGLATSGLDERGQPLPFTGFDFADFLLGLPHSASIRFGSANNYFRGAAYSIFVRDDWRIRRHFTLNFGLRYEFFPPLKEKYGRIANLDIAPDFTGAAVVTPATAGPYSGRFPEALIDPDRNNLSPRIGWAWRAGPRLVVRGGYGIFYDGSVYNRFATRLASQPPFANTGHLTTSLARPLTIRDGLTAIPAAAIRNTFAVDRSYRLGYAQTWNFSLQREIFGPWLAELSYLGTKGTRLDIQRAPNRAPPGSPLTAEQRRRIANAVGFIWDSSEGNSIYHALQARLTRRFRRGLSLNALYTWSKSLDNASSIGGAGNMVAQNDRDLRAERGLSSFDQRHALSVSYLLSTPGHGRSSVLRGPAASHLLANWTLSGSLTLHTGQPFTARVAGNRADSGGTGVVGSGRADATGAPVTSPGSRFFNLAAFTLPPPGRFGNAGRNTIPGPNFLAFNAALGRSFRFGESRRWLEVRLEATNLTNHVNYTRLDTVVNSLNYGLATQTGPMRTLTASLRYRF